jgi:hypothetical protein
MIMNFGSAFNALFAKPSVEAAVTDVRNEIKASFFGSKRFVLLLAAVAFFYLTYAILSLVMLEIVAGLVGLYMICETASNITLTKWNGMIKMQEVANDVEYARIAAAEKAGQVIPGAPGAPAVPAVPAPVKTSAT